MKTGERTLENLRNSLRGKVHVYLKDEETVRRFFADAAAQGWRFGAISPAECPLADLVALEADQQLSHVGIAGRICFQTNGGDAPNGTYHRIDYAKYVRGDAQYAFCGEDRAISR